MIRRIIQIDEEKCNGCGACAKACHEGAIGMVNGKARLLRDEYCDGLGDCLPECPTNAITFVEREAAEYDEQAVMANKQNKECAFSVTEACPSANAAKISMTANDSNAANVANAINSCPANNAVPAVSQLGQWPCQIKLVPVSAPYYQNAKLLIAADCTAYAYANMHSEFMRGKITLIGCPKLDSVDYSVKLTEIIKNNDIKSVTIVRMEVPCCGGLEFAAKKALQQSGKFIPWQVVTIGIDGQIKDS